MFTRNRQSNRNLHDHKRKKTPVITDGEALFREVPVQQTLNSKKKSDGDISKILQNPGWRRTEYKYLLPDNLRIYYYLKRIKLPFTNCFKLALGNECLKQAIAGNFQQRNNWKILRKRINPGKLYKELFLCEFNLLTF